MFDVERDNEVLAVERDNEVFEFFTEADTETATFPWGIGGWGLGGWPFGAKP